MKAITTEYKGPTNHSPARIVARDGDNNRIVMSEPHDCNRFDMWHRRAALDLARKMGWGWEPKQLSSGWQKGATYVHVFNGRD